MYLGKLRSDFPFVAFIAFAIEHRRLIGGVVRLFEILISLTYVEIAFAKSSTKLTCSINPSNRLLVE